MVNKMMIFKFFRRLYWKYKWINMPEDDKRLCELMGIDYPTLIKKGRL